MSLQVQDTYNKENQRPLNESSNGNFHVSDPSRTKTLQDDNIRLEKLYSEQVLRTQSAHSEQERLELELLDKEKVILQQQTNLKKMSELNKSLSKKLSGEIGYYESELENHRKIERDWQQQTNKLKLENQKYDHLLKIKNDEIHRLNEEVDKIMNDLDSKSDEVEKLSVLLNDQNQRNEVESLVGDSDDEILPAKKVDLSFDDSFDDDGFSEMLIQDEDDDQESELEEQYDTTDNSSSLATELNDKLGEREKLVKQYQFEIKSLRNEKVQLYNYINKLLRNPSHPKQNEVLKQKLVTRKILRATSASIDLVKQTHIVEDNSSLQRSVGSKRVISNYVNFKDYGTADKRRPNADRVNYNSDDESDKEGREDNDIELERLFLGYSSFGNKLLGIIPRTKLKATNLLLPDIGDDDDDWEDIIEEDID